MIWAALLCSADPFLIEHVDTPEGVVAEVGGIDVRCAREGVGLLPSRCSVCSGRQRVAHLCHRIA